MMIYPGKIAHEGDDRISSHHNAALRKEIGERLATGLDRKPAGLSPHLSILMRRLRDEPSRIQPDLNP